MGQTLGPLIIDVAGFELTPEDAELLAHPLVGGIILFARNYADRQQLSQLCERIRLSRKSPLLIMVDQEGGRVQRFLEGFTRLPALATLGERYDQDSAQALAFAKDCGWLMATELLSVNIDLSLSPVLDLNKGISSIIGHRAFHAKPKAVIALAQAFIQGMQEAGMAATGKHFPGHGSVTLDSHLAMPQDERTFEQIEQDDLLPFTKIIASGIQAIMAAHIIFPKVDKLPVGFSSFWLQEILRKKLKFSGIIMSDDLNMEGANISSNYADRVALAREAGCDLALLCNNRPGVITVVDNLPYRTQQLSAEQWQPLQGKAGNTTVTFQEHPRWLRTNELLKEMNAYENS